MLSFSYTNDLQLREQLHHIDELKNKILTMPLSPKTEMRLMWEASTIRIWATLALSDRDIPKHEIATILAHPTKGNKTIPLLFAQEDVYRLIHTDWRANPKPVSLALAENIFTMLFGNSERSHRTFEAIEPVIKETIAYLSAAEEHPVIQSGICHMQLLTATDATEDDGLFARAMAYVYLAKYGYDLRGFVAPERAWEDDHKTYDRLRHEYTQTNVLTDWLLFVSQTFDTTLARLYEDITNTRFHIEFPASFWELTDRQRDILSALDAPDATITNKKVQRLFKISQITASRDLSKLATLGLLYPHGKGRSVYYTKI